MEDKKFSRKRLILLGVGGVSVIALVAGGFLVWHSFDDNELQSVQGTSDESQQAPTQQFEDTDLGLTLSFNQQLVKQPLSEQDVEAGTVAQLNAKDPAVSVTVRQETGLRAVAALSRTDTASLIETNIDRSLPDRYPDFDLVENTSVTINDEEVIQRVFTYIGPDGQTVKQRFLAFIKNDDTAVYVSMQATEAQYDTVARDFFDPLQASIILE